MRDNSVSSRAVDLMRFSFLFMMVFPHSSFRTIDIDGTLTGAGGVVEQVFSYALPEMGLSIFFFLSGYFFYTGSRDGISGQWVKAKLSRRVRSLLVPYVLWNIIFLAYAVIKHNLLLVMEGLPPNLNVENLAPWSQWWRFFWDNADINGMRKSFFGLVYIVGTPVLDTLWFLRNLMVMILISLVFWPLLRRKAGIILCALGFLLSLRYDFTVEGFSFSSLMVFFLGVCLSSRGISLEKAFYRLGRVLWLPWIAVVILCATDLVGRYNGLLILGSLMSVPAFYFLSYVAVRKNILRTTPFMDASLMFVYCAHAFIYVRVADFLIRPVLSGSGAGACLLRFFLVPILALLLCMSVAWVIRRLAPGLFDVLSGGRSARIQTELKNG